MKMIFFGAKTVDDPYHLSLPLVIQTLRAMDPRNNCTWLMKHMKLSGQSYDLDFSLLCIQAGLCGHMRTASPPPPAWSLHAFPLWRAAVVESQCWWPHPSQHPLAQFPLQHSLNTYYRKDTMLPHVSTGSHLIFPTALWSNDQPHFAEWKWGCRSSSTCSRSHGEDLVAHDLSPVQF